MKLIHPNNNKGFTFVELLIIMVIVAVLSGIGIQFVLSIQEDKAKLTNIKSFLAKDVPTAIYSCILNHDRQRIAACDRETLLAENIDSETEWGGSWTSAVNIIATDGTNNARETLTLCYPLVEAGDKRADELGPRITEYLDSETSWADNETVYAYLRDSDGPQPVSVSVTVSTAGVTRTMDVAFNCSKERNQFAITYIIRQ